VGRDIAPRFCSLSNASRRTASAGPQKISISSAATAPSAGVRHMHIVVQFRAVRSLDIPPPLGHGMVGGVAVRQKNLPGPQIKRQKAMCCDSVAMRAVSSRCQLKSLRDERWRRPLKPWEGEQKKGPIPAVQSYGCLRSSRVVVLRVFST
jgi:hypothetical protein